MSHLQEQFEAFDRDNPQVWDLFVRYTDRAIAAGLSHYSSDAVLHRLRWHTNVDTRGAGEVDGKQLKINNNYSAYFARKYAARFPEHAGFFQIRNLSSDRLIVGANSHHDAAVNA